MAEKNGLKKTSGPSIYLAGFMCAGKTSVGREIARLAGMPHFDTDMYVRKISGRSPAELIIERGEKYFRSVESRCAEKLLSRHGVVVSFGGGLHFNRGRLNVLRRKNGVTVWLRTSQKDIVGRIAKDPSSYPLVGETQRGRIAAKVRSLLSARAGLYGASDISIRCGAATPAEIAAEILRRLPSLDKAGK